MADADKSRPTARVLLLAPHDPAAAIWQALLAGDGYACRPCSDATDLFTQLERGADLALVSDDALTAADAERLPSVLRREPDGSDSTIVLLTTRSEASPLGSWSMDTAADVVVLERPFPNLTLRSVVRSEVEGRRKRRDALERLRDADRRKDEFLATLAHELRNPLAPLRTGLDILHLGSYDAAVWESVVDTMDRQVAHLVRLVNDLLEVSRITRGIIVLHKERIELREIVRRAIEACQPVLDAVPHELTLDVPAAATVEADPIRLTQVVANLIDNAARYTGAGGRISITAHPETDMLVLSVKDTGVGISAQMLPRVFDLFARDPGNGRDPGAGGLGLGLTMVRELVRLHGGSVEARSSGPGRGSELLVHLPISAGGGPAPDAGAPAGESAESPGSESAESPGSNGNGAGSTRGSGGPAAASRGSKAEAGAAGASPPIRVLVVDDNVDSAQTLGTLLGRLGHQVRIAHDGKSALDAAREHAPQLVLLDLSMPGIDGFTVARRLRDERRTAVPPRLVALTGFGNDDARRRTREAGFDDHLVKPVDLSALRELLSRPVARD